MAEGWDVPQSRVRCRYFMHGACQEGTDCHFSHDRSHQPSNVCKYYMNGHCSYGSACRYDHIKPNKSKQAQQQQPPPQTHQQHQQQHRQPKPLSVHAKEFKLGGSSSSVPHIYSFSVSPSDCHLNGHCHVTVMPQQCSTVYCVPGAAQCSSGDTTQDSAELCNEQISLWSEDPPDVTDTSPVNNSPAPGSSYQSSSHLSNMTVLSNNTTYPHCGSSLENTNRYNNNNVNPPSNSSSQALSGKSNSNSTNGASRPSHQAKSVASTSKDAPSKPRRVTSDKTATEPAVITATNTTISNKTIAPVQLPNSSWADAPEFVPRSYTPSSKEGMTWANVAGGTSTANTAATTSSIADTYSELCPFYYMTSQCNMPDCPYIHGDVCDICQIPCLHPGDAVQRKAHMEDCSRQFEVEMEHSFAVARSQDKQCGICMDIVMERSMQSQRRFGILPNCSHIYCLDCIRKWRQSKQFENKIVRSCPECRIQSDYIIPSRYWVDETDKEEKKKLVDSYRVALGQKECKYFNKGEGQCPFGNKCFYRHALPDGTIKDVGPPRRRRRMGVDGEVQVFLDNNMILWDFMEEREQRLELLRGSIQSLLLELEIEDIDDNFFIRSHSDSDSDL